MKATTTKETAHTAGPVRAVRTPGGYSFRMNVRAALVVLLLALVAAAAAVVLIGSGDFSMTPGEVLTTLFGHGTFQQEFIVTDLRLPRVLVGLLVGGALGAAAPSSRPSPATRSAAPTCSASGRAPRSARSP